MLCHDGAVRYVTPGPHLLWVVTICLVAVLAAGVSVRKRDIPGAIRVASRVLLFGVALAVLEATLFGTTAPTTQVNLIPGASIAALSEDDNRNPFENVVGNIVLFLPLGFLCYLAIRRGLWFVTGLGCGWSVLIEATQWLVGRRWVDIDDVLLNTAGTFVGAVAAAVALRTFRRRSAAHANKTPRP